MGWSLLPTPAHRAKETTAVANHPIIVLQSLYRENPKRFIHQADTELWKFKVGTEFAPDPGYLAHVLSLLVEMGEPAGSPSLIKAYHKLVRDLRAIPNIVNASYSDEDEEVDEEAMQRQRDRWSYS